MKTNKIIIVSIFALILVSVAFSCANATVISPGRDGGGSTVISPGTDKKIITISNPLKVHSIGEAINVALDYFVYIAVLFAVGALIWTGFLFVNARGNSSKMSEAKTRLMYIVIGIAIIIGARLIISVVLNTLKASGVVDEKVINSANQAIRQ